MSLSLYFHTIRHLRPIQVYGRILSRFYSPPIDQSPPPDVRPRTGQWAKPTAKAVRLIGPSRFRFLNEEREVGDAASWNDGSAEELWLYNLHYFDDLNAKDARARTEWHRSLLTRWLEENPAKVGVGWDPYPLSRRTVNWIKWSLSGNELCDELTKSLAVQTRYLSKRFEIHLLGNHLLANAVALLFSGLFFTGKEADRWRDKGERILRRELHEQVLADGGYFERSPMYHSIVLEDLLDCMNVLGVYGEGDGELSRTIASKAALMLEFLRDTLHPDGDVPFFNDTAFGISAHPRELIAYGKRLGIDLPERKSERISSKRDSGLWILRHGDATVIVNAGCIGPDYLPGHAQCDTLSYEMSVGTSRVVVNSGIYTYQGKERNAFRATAAHNTVRIDGEEQHEIWARFRVARRGYPLPVSASASGGALRFAAGHTGYQRLRGRPVHYRRITCEDNTWTIEDQIDGSGAHTAESYIHLHPEISLADTPPGTVECHVPGHTVTIEPFEGEMRVEGGYYSPEFGKKYENTVLVLHREGEAPFSMGYRIVVKDL